MVKGELNALLFKRTLFVREFMSAKRLRHDDRNQRNKQDNLRFARKEEWIMPPKKKTTKKQEGKKDIFDFIKDASQARSTVGIKFLEELGKPGANAEALTQLLKREYGGVTLPDVTKLLDIYKNRPIIRNFMDSISQRSY